ncbi:MAG: sugar phosphate isomerase/epimerase [Armatimonadetes bacterium]|nr:sugar phosphate isomerase/epimerase [Armatimonadota bacterium]
MKLSVQLYTVRDKMDQDAAATLVAIRKMGLRFVETAGFAGHKPAEFAKFIKDAGLRTSGMHVSYDACEKEIQKVIHEAHLCDSKYVIVPGLPGRATEKGWGAAGEKLASFGEKCYAAGLGFAYHNHSHEFEMIGSHTALDILYSAGCPDYLKCQLDLFWVYYGNVDCVKLLEQYGSRVKLVHLKDGKGRGNSPQAEAGDGVMDWDKILPACKKAGVEFGAIEFDTAPRDPLLSIKASLDYFRSKGFTQ